MKDRLFVQEGVGVGTVIVGIIVGGAVVIGAVMGIREGGGSVGGTKKVGVVVGAQPHKKTIQAQKMVKLVNLRWICSSITLV